MAEPRKIVLILGNGFDLDLELKTSYRDFWESEFCPKDYPAPLIHHLNQCWEDNLEAVKWYDLENELLNYYKSIPDPTKGKDILTQEEKEFLKNFTALGWQSFWYEDKIELVQSLVDKGVLLYRQRPIPAIDEHFKKDALQSPIWRDHKALQLIKEGLCKYLTSIDKPVTESLSVAFHLLLSMTKCVKAGDTVEIYSFNYTRVNMQGYSVDGIPIYYMHGRCEDGKIIVGTRDGTPIVPEYDFIQKVMDDSFRPPDILTALDDADEVIIFGHSLGENDCQYFEQFFTKQVDRANHKVPYIFIFTRDSNSMNEIKRSLKSLTGDHLSTLYSTNQPIIIRTNELKEDQQLFFDFLVDHHTDLQFAEVTVGELLAAQKENKKE